MQNVPSHAHDIRLMFSAKVEETTKDVADNRLQLYKNTRLKTDSGWVTASDIAENNFIYANDENNQEKLVRVISVTQIDDKYIELCLAE